MTDDLVKRLRERSCQYVDNEYNFDKRSADRIEQLEAALRKIERTEPEMDYDDVWVHQKIARAALGKKKDD